VVSKAGARGPGHQSLTAKIYAELRSRIITGVLPPGTRLRERELAEDLGVSRIPLREALPQLEADGFVQTGRRRGAIVTELSLTDVEELFDVRLGVEVYATRLAARRVAAGASPEAIGRAMDTAEQALASADVNWIAEANADFHEEIIRLAGNSLLSSMMRSVAGRDRWIFRMTSDRDPVVACREHHELCDAITAGDEAFAAAISYGHIERGRRPTLDVLAAVLPQERPGD
jgi:DNA-binding GntR family transcriptional regulator